MTRKASKKLSERVEIWDKIFDNIDAETLLAAALGAVMVSGGIDPPITHILKAWQTNDARGPVEQGIDSAWWDVVKLGSPLAMLSGGGASIGSAWTSTAKIGSPLLFVLGLTDGSAAENETSVKVRGAMASGAAEMMLLAMLMKNPQAQEHIIEALKAIPSIKAL